MSAKRGLLDFEEFLRSFSEIRRALYNLGKPLNKQLQYVSPDKAIDDFRAGWKKDKKFKRAMDYYQRIKSDIPAKPKGWMTVKQSTELLNAKDYFTRDFNETLRHPREFETGIKRKFLDKLPKRMKSSIESVHDSDVLDELYRSHNPALMALLRAADSKAKSRPTDKATVDKINKRRSEYGHRKERRKWKDTWDYYDKKEKVNRAIYQSHGVQTQEQLIDLMDIVLADPFVAGNREVELEGGRVSVLDPGRRRPPRHVAPPVYRSHSSSVGTKVNPATRWAEQKRDRELRAKKFKQGLVDERGYMTAKALEPAYHVDDSEIDYDREYGDRKRIKYDDDRDEH